MNKVLLFIIFFLMQFTYACNCLTFEEAQKKAIKENKFILFFYNDWHQMDDDGKGIFYLPSMSKEENEIAKKYIYLCNNFGNIKSNLYKKWRLSDKPVLLISDANGMELYRFTEPFLDREVYEVLNVFSTPIEDISFEMKNYLNKSNYNTALRLSQKYYDYSMYIQSAFKKHVIKLANFYLTEAEKNLSKKDKEFIDKTQKIELIKLYKFAFNGNLDVLNERISEFEVTAIFENNKDVYYFLKLLGAKAMQTEDLIGLETKIKLIDDFDYYIKKTDLILAQQN